jgi:predicted AlkP superfamily phosphohydrolase/phosphomutase
VRTKAKLTRHFLGRGDWDLFMQVFTESHCVGHQCWHLHDPAHPAHDPSVRAETGDPLLRVYQAIDGAIGEILEDAGDAFVFLFSAHGMDYRYGAQFLLKEILLRLGVTTAVQAGPSAQERISLPLALLRWAWRRMPEGVRQGLAPLRDQVRGDGTGSALPFLGVDFSSSLCFPVPNGLAVGGIRLNLAEREPEGTLDPADADAFSAELAADLLAIHDRRTGRPLIKAVHRTSEVYDGTHLDHLPDLLVEWDDSVPTGSINLGDGTGAAVHAFSEKTGPLDGANDYGRSGEHRESGMFIAAGNGLRPNRLERGVSILDLAPTLTKLLGVDLPECEGKPIPELLE